MIHLGDQSCALHSTLLAGLARTLTNTHTPPVIGCKLRSAGCFASSSTCRFTFPCFLIVYTVTRCPGCLLCRLTNLWVRGQTVYFHCWNQWELVDHVLPNGYLNIWEIMLKSCLKNSLLKLLFCSGSRSILYWKSFALHATVLHCWYKFKLPCTRVCLFISRLLTEHSCHELRNSTAVTSVALAVMKIKSAYLIEHQ